MDTDSQKIKALIEQALADGSLSREEDEMIKAAIAADNVVTEEEMKLYRELQQQVFEGDIKIED